jgi:hypothetical protein
MWASLRLADSALALDASIDVSDVKTGEIVFASEAHKDSSAHRQQSTAEACAKHLNDKIEGK